MILNRTPVLVPRGDLSNGMTAAQLDMLLQYELYWAWDDDSGQGALYISEDNTLKKIGIKYGTFTTLANGLVPASTTADKRYLGADGDWHGVFSTGNMGLVPAPSSGDSGKYLRSDGTWQTVSGGGTTYPVLSSQQHSSTGEYVVNGSGNNTSYFLRGDGTWTNVASTLSASAHANGTRYFVNGSGTGTDKFLRGDGTWQYIPWNSILNAPNLYPGINIDEDNNLGTFNTSFHTIKDYDGNIYHEVQIGKQIWLIEPVRATHFINGDSINNATSTSTPDWNTLSYIDATQQGDQNMGLFYTHRVAQAMTYTGMSFIEGYRLPTRVELNELKTFLQGRYGDSAASAASNDSMLSQYTWNSGGYSGAPGYDTANNNASGFSALPEGYIDANGWQGDPNLTGQWPDSLYDVAVFWNRDMEIYTFIYDNDAMDIDDIVFPIAPVSEFFFQIRLIKDDQTLATVAYTGNYNDLTNRPDLNPFHCSDIYYGEISNSALYIYKEDWSYRNWTQHWSYFSSSEIDNLTNKQIQVLITDPNIVEFNNISDGTLPMNGLLSDVYFATGQSSFVHKPLGNNTTSAVLTQNIIGGNWYHPILNIYIQSQTAWFISATSSYTTRSLPYRDHYDATATSGNIYFRLYNGRAFHVIRATDDINLYLSKREDALDVHEFKILVYNNRGSGNTIRVSVHKDTGGGDVQQGNERIQLQYLILERTTCSVSDQHCILITIRQIDNDYFRVMFDTYENQGLFGLVIV